MVSLPATWETRGERRLKERSGFLEEQLHGARGEAGDWSHGGGWDSTDAEVVNSTTGADFPEGFLARLVDWSTDTFSLGSTSWIRVGGRLIKEAIASLGRRIDGQQAQQVPPLDGAQYDHTVPPPPPPSQSAPQAMPFTLHSQTEVAPPPVTVPTPTSEDPHARMDRLEQGLRQLRTSDRAITWEGFDGVPVASLPAKFRMPDIERYTSIGCPRLHLRLYSTVMRAHGLDEPQMITLFPLSLSGAAQRWFASLEASRRRTWDDLAQEFLRQFSFNTVVDVSRRELEALRQRAEESVSSFISRWRGKIAEIIDRPSERDQIQMVLRSL
ncbi:hypothetical protein VitviT2T_024160 [Vitis vinifera]|uniref:Retrotransposon gag domain-containing protein n=1 Tax=Vitis vinifera TaxID=29760 RepID=A0ABY9DHC1_VITVI|nr:hypothetical protein VitviT2T_024160 [Vitis vinifera]